MSKAQYLTWEFSNIIGLPTTPTPNPSLRGASLETLGIFQVGGWILLFTTVHTLKIQRSQTLAILEFAQIVSLK